MPTAARSPAATASTTDEGPVTASPPAKIHFSEVCPVTGLTWMNSLPWAWSATSLQIRFRSSVCPIATSTWSAMNRLTPRMETGASSELRRHLSSQV